MKFAHHFKHNVGESTAENYVDETFNVSVVSHYDFILFPKLRLAKAKSSMLLL